MGRLWKALVMLVAAASIASCGGGGGGLGGGCSDDDIGADFFYGYGLEGTVGVEMRVEPDVIGVPSQCSGEMRFSVDSGSLPPGITLGERSGVISGVPTQGGRFPFIVRLTVKGFDGGLNAHLVSLIHDPAEATFPRWEVMSDGGQGFSHHFRIGAIGSDLYVVERYLYQPRTLTFRSVDSGRTWAELNVVRPEVYVEEFALASDGTHIYMSGGNRKQGQSSAVWRFDGTTWTLMTEAGAFGPRAGHTMLSHEGALYILGGYGPGGHSLGDVWRSTDGGVTWTQQSASAFPRRFRFCALSDGKGSLYVIGGHVTPRNSFPYLNDVWQSRDSGVSWQQVPIDSNSPLADALGYKEGSCGLLRGRIMFVGRFHTVSSKNGRDWLIEPHLNSLSNITPGAITVDGHMYVLTGEGTSQKMVVRTGR